MTRKIPIVATLVVALAVATMIGLGFWQLQRRHEKEALIELYRANLSKPAMAFPALAPVSREAMFRSAAVLCIEVAGWRTEGAGAAGFRHIAECRTGAEGPGALIDMGVARDPNFKPRWGGGEARGIVTTEPDHSSLIARLFGRGKILSPMLISSQPAPGLQASAAPNPDSIPNNHFGYAIQWFLFAAVAVVIYVLALRKRQREEPNGDG